MYPHRTREYPQFSQAFRSRKGGQERGGGGGGGQVRGPPPPPPRKFFVNVRFFSRALEVPFLKEVTKNVHENYYG